MFFTLPLRPSSIQPIDRGITGSILSEPSGYHENKIEQCDRWSKELDELPNFVTTCYLAWPIWDFAAQKSVGVVEFRNKSGNGISFSPADLQFARIIALQLGHAVIHYKQQEREYCVWRVSLYDVYMSHDVVISHSIML